MSRGRSDAVRLGPTGRAVIAVAVLAVPLGAAGLGLSNSGGPATTPAQTVAPEPAVAAAPAAVRADVVPTAGRPGKPVAAPAGLSVPAIGLNTGAPERLGLDPAGRLTAPVDYDRTGWYAQGPKPGEAGPAVIVGHVDSFRGPAVFFRLREMKVGQEIVVTRTDGWKTRFVVDSVRSYPKDAFASDEVYGPTANAQLRLITCGGAFDRDVRSYEDNVVVFASVH
ncbi:class F sortase [Pseudonocardia sp. KRD291]|uniref:class F sortase n=1 Tax=Pseudonocardia sp. KRD291 TaxID=2792007 RepID=UPI001C4A7643|nr:class F sortase [Pseudonocardia sp. KRD291]MBW0101574.1 class F sortase [Pseudonocardia sp. KRD291]